MVLIGVSGTGKTTVSGILASRDILVANVPFVEGAVRAPVLLGDDVPRVVALTAQVGTLVKVRRERLARLGEPLGSDFCRVDRIRRELLAAHRTCLERQWDIIDVSGQTPVETADLVQSICSLE